MISRPPVTSELKLRLNADNPPPTTVLFDQQLKSTLGDALKLMLPLFFHVHQVSTLDFDHAAAGRTAPSPPCVASRLCTTSRPVCARTGVARGR